MRRQALGGKVPRNWLVRDVTINNMPPLGIILSLSIPNLRFHAILCCLFHLKTNLNPPPQLGGGPRPVTDSWEHMWWDNLHWKRCAARSCMHCTQKMIIHHHTLAGVLGPGVIQPSQYFPCNCITVVYPGGRWHGQDLLSLRTCTGNDRSSRGGSFRRTSLSRRRSLAIRNRIDWKFRSRLFGTRCVCT